MPDIVWILPGQLTLSELVFLGDCGVMLYAGVLIAVDGPFALEQLL